MFYEPAKGHGLPHDPSRAIVSPRPIGWISTKGKDGSVNLAPYSFFNMFSAQPFMVWFSSDGVKDSVTYARETGEFVVNVVGRDLTEQMVATSVDAPLGTSEFEYAGLTPAPSHLVSPPRVAEALAALECKVTEIFQPKDIDGKPIENVVVTGQVVGVHIDEAAITDGRFDVLKVGNVSRLGYMDYDTVEKVFQRKRPVWEK